MAKYMDVHTWLDPESGKVFCLPTGPSKEAVLRVHEKASQRRPSAVRTTPWNGMANFDDATALYCWL
ncbi:nickel-binding protein [Nonomuraea lactucae]|uniref:nickel-binding protein n=1 Tax=Nonomuraea lactucae TaxID=2249762 RepID=UPI001963248F|nr:nickel-binding protein [Nonomuraea lactucae]